MVSEKDFTIPFSSLKIGVHSFNFKIVDSFFTLYDHFELSSADINVEILLDKKVNHLSLDVKLNGKIKLNCDRCTDDYWQPINEHFDLIVKFSKRGQESNDDDIIVLSSNDHSLSLSQSIYEFIYLSLPTKRQHLNEKDCNQEMIESIKQYICFQNEQQKFEDTDPRWAKLKNIKN